MKSLDFNEMSLLQGGDFVDGFCKGYGTVAAGYAVGVAANLWNPIGWTGTIVGAAIGIGCLWR